MKLYLTIIIFLPFLVFAQYEEDEWAERDTWMPVQELFEIAEIEKGKHVADIGCHEGYLSIHLANKVGSDGKVYAVDVREDRLDLLNGHLASRNLENVSVILGDYDNPKLPNSKLDVVFIIDTYHEMTDYEEILEHVHKALKPGGKVIILEKLKSWVRDASRNEQVEAHSLGPKYVKKELRAAKFKITKELKDMGDWENDEDKPMWLLIAEKPMK